jgi:hypothetical protein
MKYDAVHRFWVRMTVLAGVAGLLYSSWPLGYLLNPGASKKGLASALEALNQPYNWVFITGDVLSSLLILLICWLIWRHYQATARAVTANLILVGWSIFALGTFADTLLPEHCLPGSASCLSWHHDHILLAHGILSILAALSLFAVLLLVWWRSRTPLYYVLLLGYSVFGLLSLYEALSPNQGNFSQHYYITLCGIWTALIPYAIHRTFFGGEPELSGKKSSA